jgi:hypothetical protein
MKFAAKLFIYYVSSRTINVPCFLQSYMLSNDASRPTFNAISHE